MATEFITVKGLRELAVAARKLNDEVKQKIAANAVLAGARITRDAARALAPVLKSRYHDDPRRRPGTLRRKIVAVKVRKGDYPEEVMSLVGVRLLSRGAISKFKQQTGKAGAQNPDDAFYGDMVELGTSAHTHRRVSIPGVRFLKRGFEGTAERAAREIRDKAGREIIRFGNRLG
jgi:HK97 gp10 family phage protein